MKPEKRLFWVIGPNRGVLSVIDERENSTDANKMVEWLAKENPGRRYHVVKLQKSVQFNVLETTKYE